MCPSTHTPKVGKHSLRMIFVSDASMTLPLQVALITSMLPDCSRDCSVPEQLQDSTPEQLQDSITVATVDSYQADSPSSYSMPL